MKKIVIIPALNPDICLKDIVHKNLAFKNQVILVNDGSDGSYNPFLKELSEKCTVLHHDENKGKGEAIKTALKYIKEKIQEYSIIGIMDADGQHLPEDMNKLLIKAENNSRALILGCRTIDDAVPWKSRMGNQLTRQVFRLLTGVAVSDTQTGLRAFSSEVLDFMSHVSGERYEYEMNVLVSCTKENIDIIEVPIETIYHDKDNSCSHFRKVRDSILIYQKLFKFSLVSFSSFLLDYVMFLLLIFVFPQGIWSVMAANITARILSAIYNYIINCHFVFHEKESTKTVVEYLCLAGMILILNNMILQIFMYVFYIPVYPAKIMTEITLFICSWLVQKKIIFRNITEKRGEHI